MVVVRWSSVFDLTSETTFPRSENFVFLCRWLRHLSQCAIAHTSCVPIVGTLRVPPFAAALREIALQSYTRLYVHKGLLVAAFSIKPPKGGYSGYGPFEAVFEWGFAQEFCKSNGFPRVQPYTHAHSNDNQKSACACVREWLQNGAKWLHLTSSHFWDPGCRIPCMCKSCAHHVRQMAHEVRRLTYGHSFAVLHVQCATRCAFLMESQLLCNCPYIRNFGILPHSALFCHSKQLPLCNYSGNTVPNCDKIPIFGTLVYDLFCDKNGYL